MESRDLPWKSKIFDDESIGKRKQKLGWGERKFWSMEDRKFWSLEEKKTRSLGKKKDEEINEENGVDLGF